VPRLSLHKSSCELASAPAPSNETDLPDVAPQPRALPQALSCIRDSGTETDASVTPSTDQSPWIVGLTGGIGSGKSTVAELFAQLGVPVVDADVVGRELVVPGSRCLAQIVETFGSQVLAANATLDRAALRQRVFADEDARRRLEAILHPAILTEMQRRTAAATAPYVLFVIPLLFETGQNRCVDRVLLVDAPTALQRERIRARDGLDETTIEAILTSQWSRQARLAAADDVIVNDSERGVLAARVAELHMRYLDLARARPRH
jgi:dephospho-CoA kinase